MKPMSRREALLSLAGGGASLLLGGAGALGQAAARRSRMGIVTYALGIHAQNQWAGRHQGLAPALALLEESRRLGAGGIQVELGSKDAPHVAELRRRAGRDGMYVEVSIAPPRNDGDLARFEKDVQLAKEAGASLARTVILAGRRYEQFRSLEEFRTAEKQGLASLRRAEPILARHRFRLAVENHKDQRVAEKLAMLKSLQSEFIGLCVDFGNNFPLMEDPIETVRALAPWALCAHIKDQAVREYAEGFLFADMALGDGFLDLPAMVKVLCEAKPGLKFSYETITRDALKVPVLTEGFWATLTDTPAKEFARTWQVVKRRGHPEPFVTVSQLPLERQLALEQGGLERSLAYAREKLGL
jgi:3-oxoisoapionate decarboxylase